MSSYNDYDGFPIQSSYYWLTTRLRGEMGFRGYVVSDSDAVEYLYTKHGTAKDMKEAVRQSVEAGLNVRCTFRSPDSYVLPLRELVKEGGLSEEVINDRVRDILRVKFLVGLFDTPYQTDLKGADEEVEKKENEEVALQASRESIVLLKNEKNVLPLDPSKIRKIAVCGPNADEHSYALTHYGPLAVEVTSVLKGIQEKMKDKADVLYTKGCDLVDANWPESELIDYPLTDEEQKEIDKAVSQAKQAGCSYCRARWRTAHVRRKQIPQQSRLTRSSTRFTKSSSGYGKACRVGSYQRTSIIYQLGRQVCPCYSRGMVSGI